MRRSELEKIGARRNKSSRGNVNSSQPTTYLWRPNVNVMPTTLSVPRLAGIAALSLVALGLPVSTSAQYAQTNLVSNIPGLATITDPLLVNPWGISRSAASPFWVSNQGTGTSTLYSVAGSTAVTRVNIAPNGFVAIPTTAAGPQGPTGQVSNSNTASFQLAPGNTATSARFIFANLNGTISGWAGGASATIEATTPGAVYTGLAITGAA